ncbi:MAG: hypothetical protein KDK30_04325 [Leptospiraceae bacterium]|nr:hypothetical protein [Leptospiraceae bacterium]MCB1316087.1 hypothetical protein [Leptospiraceae bacterium]
MPGLETYHRVRIQDRHAGNSGSNAVFDLYARMYDAGGGGLEFPAVVAIQVDIPLTVRIQ